MSIGRVRERWMPAALAILFFIVYIHTACPSVGVGDSGELTAAAHALAIPHGTVMSRLHYARRALAERMKDDPA